MHFPRAAMIALMGVLAGCATNVPSGHNPVIPSAASASHLRPGDSLTMAIIGVPDPSTNSVQIDDKGLISLPYIGALKASGETTAGLTDSIREAYVTQKIYTAVDISVSVTERYVYVGGEVVKPGRIVWTPDLTAAKAIAVGGRFHALCKGGQGERRPQPGPLRDRHQARPEGSLPGSAPRAGRLDPGLPVRVLVAPRRRARRPSPSRNRSGSCPPRPS